jgi:hypothetical protein
MDPRANAVGKPPLSELMTRGALPRAPRPADAHDALVTHGADTRRSMPDARELGPHGHNVMVEAPARVWDWVAAAEAAEAA